MAGSTDDSTRGSLSLEDLYGSWLARREAGDESDLETLCAAHPGRADELRRLHALRERLERLLGGDEGHAPLLAAAGPAGRLLARLAGRRAAQGRYALEGEIDRGGQGAVVRVWDEDLQRPLAMKVLLGRLEEPSAGATPPVDVRTLGRFLGEAQVTCRLDHPGVVPVHELGLDGEGRVYFTMKLVQGRTLEAVLDLAARGEEGWTRARALAVLQKVCEATAYAHHKGVVHRDLKPANVMVGRFGEVYVMDWGLAKVLRREDAPPAGAEPARRGRSEEAEPDELSPLSTRDGDVIGTPAYMPPEQARGRIADLGPRSDVYSVGAILYHLLAGHGPYAEPGAPGTSQAVLRRVREGPPPPLSACAPDAPAELVAICERAMARAPEDRYADMGELGEDLAAYVEGRVVAAYEGGAWAEAKKWVRRNRPLSAALAAAALAVLGGGVAFALEARRATHALALARAETAKVLRLSDVKVQQELRAEADELWPAHPEQIPLLESWLRRATALADRLPIHRATLVELRARARPWTDEERARERAEHPRAAELAAKRSELESVLARLAGELDAAARASAEERVARLEPEVDALEAETASRRTWRFDSAEDQWQHDLLVELIEGVEGLEAGLSADDACTADHGWSVPKRLAFARELEAGFGDGGRFAEAWSRALPAIRAAYADLELEPQMGLVPVGPDPDSGLWEFAHLMTGAPAERGPDGRPTLTEETGVVLVLMRGGTFWMGAQKEDPAARNFDPQAQWFEGPVHEVRLSPFFLSKYEMTQAQWERLTGRNPSYFRQDELAPSLLSPVEQVSWLDCMAWLPRAGLTLPSEAQWEYGARAASSTPWWTGAERESLRETRAANLADRSAARVGATFGEIQDWPELDDGFAVHAAAGTFAANGFGLHEVAGNVWELCLDGYDPAFYRRSPRVDPVGPPGGAPDRPSRGGSYAHAALHARSAYRAKVAATLADPACGARPARAIAN